MFQGLAYTALFVSLTIQHSVAFPFQPQNTPKSSVVTSSPGDPIEERRKFSENNPDLLEPDTVKPDLRPQDDIEFDRNRRQIYPQNNMFGGHGLYDEGSPPRLPYEPASPPLAHLFQQQPVDVLPPIVLPEAYHVQPNILPPVPDVPSMFKPLPLHQHQEHPQIFQTLHEYGPTVQQPQEYARMQHQDYARIVQHPHESTPVMHHPQDYASIMQQPQQHPPIVQHPQEYAPVLQKRHEYAPVDFHPPLQPAMHQGKYALVLQKRHEYAPVDFHPPLQPAMQQGPMEYHKPLLYHEHRPLPYHEPGPPPYHVHGPLLHDGPVPNHGYIQDHKPIPDYIPNPVVKHEFYGKDKKDEELKEKPLVDFVNFKSYTKFKLNPSDLLGKEIKPIGQRYYRSTNGLITSINETDSSGVQFWGEVEHEGKDMIESLDIIKEILKDLAIEITMHETGKNGVKDSRVTFSIELPEIFRTENRTSFVVTSAPNSRLGT